jgi:hypothetical protein
MGDSEHGHVFEVFANGPLNFFVCDNRN